MTFVATVNDLIIQSAYKALRGELQQPVQNGLCLQFVRFVIEDAMSWPANHLYRWRTRVVDRPASIAKSTAMSRDMEASLRAAGMELVLARHGPTGDPTRYVTLSDPRIQPGDIAFRWDTARMEDVYVGHVGIVMPGGLLVESVAPANRPGSLSRGVTVLSRLGAWPVTTVIRFDPRKPPAS